MPSESPPRVLRRAGQAGLVLSLVLALSGCFTLKMDLQIQSDDTVDGSIVLAVDKSMADVAGGEDALIDSLRNGDEGLLSEQPSAGDVEIRDYRDDKRVGVEYVISDVPIADFSQSGAGDGSFTINRVDETFVVDGQLDIGEGLGDGTELGSQELLEEADVSIAVTFPGEVQEADGDVSGNTVSWTATPGDVLSLHAVGAAGSTFPVNVVIALALIAMLLVLGVVAILLLRRGSRPPASGVDSPDASHGVLAPDELPPR